MKSFFIDESKYSLESRLIEAKAAGNIVRLLENFNRWLCVRPDKIMENAEFNGVRDWLTGKIYQRLYAKKE